MANVLLDILTALGLLAAQLVLVLLSPVIGPLVPQRGDTPQWIGHGVIDFFNHPPQTWAVP